MIAATAASELDQRITDLGTLAVLALALVTVFTAQRVEALRQRPRRRGMERGDFVREAIVDWVLVLVTAATTLAVLPVTLDAASKLAIGHERGVLRTVFVLIWMLLVFLVIWQGTIAVGSTRQAKAKWTGEQP